MDHYRYAVKLKGRSVPPLLADLGAWLSKRDRGSLGWFDGIIVEPVPKEWDAIAGDRLRTEGFVFITLGEGSMLVLLSHSKDAPPAVVELGSEGVNRFVAPSLEKFLLDWAGGKPKVDDLEREEDDEVDDARPDLKAWLKKRGVKAPKVKAFDFARWLGGSPSEKAAPLSLPPPPKRPLTKAMQALPPKIARVVSFLGRRADDAELGAFVTKELKQKVPMSVDEGDDVHVESAKHGVELAFDPETGHADCPIVQNTARTFVPYVTYVWIYEKFSAAPFGLTWKTDAAKVTAALGPATPPSDEWPVETWTKTFGDVFATIEVSKKNVLRVRFGLATRR